MRYALKQSTDDYIAEPDKDVRSGIRMASWVKVILGGFGNAA